MTDKEILGYYDAFGTGAFRKFIEACEKGVPKKPIYQHYEKKGEKPYIKITCPNGCGIQLNPITEGDKSYEHRYCNRCGQRLDWGEEEE